MSFCIYEVTSRDTAKASCWFIRIVIVFSFTHYEYVDRLPENVLFHQPGSVLRVITPMQFWYRKQLQLNLKIRSLFWLHRKCCFLNEEIIIFKWNIYAEFWIEKLRNIRHTHTAHPLYHKEYCFETFKSMFACWPLGRLGILR